MKDRSVIQAARPGQGAARLLLMASVGLSGLGLAAQALAALSSAGAPMLANLVGLLAFVLVGALSAAGIGIQGRLAKAKESELGELSQRYTRSNDATVIALKKAHETRLVIKAAADRTVGAIHRLEGLVSGTTDGIEVLNQVLRDTSQSNEMIVASQGRLREVLKSYSGEVASESTAVESMASSLTAAAEASRRKSERAKELLLLSDGASKRLDSIQKAVARMSGSAEKMNAMNALITEVADRTNLLAMNASIEAAHAGKSGRGFAVIAGQVRLLSVETAKSSRSISDTLSETKAAIRECSGEASEAIQFFANVSAEIRGMAAMFEELTDGMQTMSIGASGLLDSVARIGRLTSSTGEAIEVSESSIGKAKASLETVVEIAATIRSDAGSMMRAFLEMRKESDRVRELGSEGAGREDGLDG